MELNWAQLLVHNDATLNKFKADHDIPGNIQIEQSSPNKDANLVEGNENQIPVQIFPIHQDGIRFSISSMLKEVMAQCHLTFMQVSVNFIWIVLVVETLMHQQELSSKVTIGAFEEASCAPTCSKVTITSN